MKKLTLDEMALQMPKIDKDHLSRIKGGDGYDGTTTCPAPDFTVTVVENGMATVYNSSGDQIGCGTYIPDATITAAAYAPPALPTNYAAADATYYYVAPAPPMGGSSGGGSDYVPPATIQTDPTTTYDHVWHEMNEGLNGRKVWSPLGEWLLLHTH